jgi:hypothetical protein
VARSSKKVKRRHQIEEMAIADLTPAEYNPRRISDEAMAGLRASLDRFGVVQPIVWNKRTGRIVGGHQRVAALAAAGEETVQVVVVDLPQDEEKTLNVTLNSPTISGEFTESLDALLDEIQGDLPDLYEELLLDELRIEEEEPEPLTDTEPEAPPVEPITKPGEVSNDDRADWAEAWALFPGDVAYVWHAPGPNSAVVMDSLHSCDLVCRIQIIWAKRHFPIGRGDYHVRHEPCWYAVRKGKASRFSGDRKQCTVWGDITLDNNLGGEDGGHSTQKPLECMARPIRNHGQKGDVVYDPFLGSGTTLIAAHDLGRICVGMEISPGYVDVICKRYRDHTGESPKRESDGSVFRELYERRAEAS